MKPTSVRFKVSKILSIVIILAAVGAPGQPNNSTIPIKFENVPVTTAINSLARLAEVNYLFDPKSLAKLDGSGIPEPTITANWTDLTAKQALDKVLKDYGLYLVEVPVTSISEITVTNRIANPVDASLLGSDTNQVVPIVFEFVPLDEALKNLIQKAQINASLDPKFLGSFKAATSSPAELITVSIHWEKVIARQAIIALCENYGLTIVKDPATGGVQIKRKE